MVEQRAGNGPLSLPPLATLWVAALLAILVVGGARAGRALIAAEGEGAAQAGATAGAATDDQSATGEAAVESAAINELIEKLGDPDYFVRDHAQKTLEGFGFQCVDLLTDGQYHEDLEVARRSTSLLKRLWANEAPRKIAREGDVVELKALLDNYTLLPESARRERILQLSRLPDAMGSEPLCRIVRYEISPLISKYAALTILEGWPGSLGANGARREVMRATLGSGDRPASAWVLAGLSASDDVPAAREKFAALASVERDLLAQRSERSERSVLRDLLAFQVALARSAGDLPNAYEISQEMVDLEPGASPTLAALVEELVAQKQWETLEKVLARFSTRFSENADLLYVLATVKKQRGAEAEAEEFASRAFALDGTDPAAHFRRAVELGRRGLWSWSEREAAFVRGGAWQTYSLFMPGDSPKAKELLVNYLGQDETVRMTRVREVVGLSEREMPERERVAVLCRFARFEPSEKLARYAAAMLLNTPFLDDLNAAFRAKLIAESIGPTDRPAGRWLRLYGESLTNATPDAAASFGKLAAEETAAIDAARLNGEGAPWEDEIVQALMIQQFSLLDRQGRRDEGVPILEQWLKRETGRIETLQPFVDLLLRVDAWSLVERIARQCDKTFQTHPVLLYSLARAHEGKNELALAKQIAQRARAMQPNEKTSHWRTAIELYIRGLRSYAEGEYQYLIELGPPRDDYTVMAKFRLADLLSDRERFAEAAELLSQALAAVQEDSALRRYIADDPAWLPSRIHWLKSEDMRVAQNYAAQAASLWEAAKLSPYDADVLISLQRHPNLSADEQAKVQKLIDEATAHFQSLINAVPEDASNYNQFAWLAANTHGDAAAAVAASHKSLELRPGTAGYLDTLGRCYFAKGDLANAVKYQSMAVRLDPYSPSLVRQLAEFRKALDDSLAAPPKR